MSEGFYYSIYPPMRVGGGPAREIYPVEQQNQDALEASLRIQARNAKTTQAFKALGAWGPVLPPANIVEANGGSVFTAIA